MQAQPAMTAGLSMQYISRLGFQVGTRSSPRRLVTLHFIKKAVELRRPYQHSTGHLAQFVDLVGPQMERGWHRVEALRPYQKATLGECCGLVVEDPQRDIERCAQGIGETWTPAAFRPRMGCIDLYIIVIVLFSAVTWSLQLARMLFSGLQMPRARPAGLPGCVRRVVFDGAGAHLDLPAQRPVHGTAVGYLQQLLLHRRFE